MATSDAPLSVGHVALTAKDPQRVGDFYQSKLGLDRLSADGEVTVLGQGNRPLVEIRKDSAATPRPREAGLFHTAFLLPDRAALGAWLRFAADQGIQLDGASDHLVSEALYLRDPEGNGIEIYADRPRDQWTRRGDEIVMDTIRLDLNDLASAARAPWAGAPDDTVIGHVHLQVGNVPVADDFFTGTLKLDRVAHMPSASFFSSGGYHHHLAGNIWNSRGAGQRSPHSTGLAEVVLLADDSVDPALLRSFDDPWGNRIVVQRSA